MGVIDGLFGALFGSGRNVLRETVEVFRENKEAGAQRDFDLQRAALAQFSTEFAVPRRAWFDRLMDGINRIPRPAMALGTLGLFISAMAAPDWFASRMVGLALVPEPLWWLLGAVVSFYFGARHQAKGQEFQQSLMATMSRLPDVRAAQEQISSSKPAPAPKEADTGTDAPLELASLTSSGNAALDAWRKLTSA